MASWCLRRAVVSFPLHDNITMHLHVDDVRIKFESIFYDLVSVCPRLTSVPCKSLYTSSGTVDLDASLVCVGRRVHIVL
jgi:hypothetical protein